MGGRAQCKGQKPNYGTFTVAYRSEQKVANGSVGRLQTGLLWPRNSSSHGPQPSFLSRPRCPAAPAEGYVGLSAAHTQFK